MIRDFKEEDLEMYKVMSKTMYHSPAVLHSISDEQLELTFSKCLAKDPFCRGLIIESDGEVAGYGLLAFTYSNEVGGLVVWCEELFIREDFRGNGLGSTFLKWLIETYRQTAKRFRLEVTASNEGAIKLYRRLGFENLDYKQMTIDLE